MKIIQASIERNFHVSNDDKFLLEKASLVAQIEDEEDEQVVLNQLRERLAYNFKNAYPKIEMSINFEYYTKSHETSKATVWEMPMGKVNGIVVGGSYSQIESPFEKPLTQEQRIIKQIQECSDLTVLSSFEPLATKLLKSQEVKTAFENKKKELQKQTV